MDQATRNKLRSVVTQCRRLLEESVAQQLQGRYDIYATGKKDEVWAEKDVPLGHLSDEEREARQDILAHFEHILALGYKPREALEQLIREIAFTHLNRLCAYKMMEVRDVYVGGQRFREAVSKGLKSQGFLFYLADHPEDERRYNAGDQESAYRHFLNWLGGTLSQEIGVLFSPTDPANRVYPPQRVLEQVLDLLNSEELKGIWSEDETIGWVYQYFTPKELRDQARKESQAPRNSYELAFRNQFFTPRYVVEFLTDNTLGRIWYDMKKGETRLKDECRYMVRPPGEVFFSEKEDKPDSSVRATRELLLNGTEENFPEFRVGDLQPVIELAHTVGGYERHPIENASDPNWWPWSTSRQIERSEDLSGFSTQDLLDVLFIHVRGHRMTGGYGDLEPVCYRIGNEVRRRCLEGRKVGATQEQLLRAIMAIPHRPKKDPREIKILDPACGSGHFLLYGFALLLVIYEEAYDDPDLGPELQAAYLTKTELRKALPELILRHNLYGIDIDLRCTQIAALALWLRCQRAYQEMGIRKDRPCITRSNIVCAEPMPGEGHMLKEFVTQIEPKLLGQLVEVVFEKMKLAGEAGSLLKIEEEIRDAVAEARCQWRIGPIATQMRLFGEPKPVERQQKFDLSGISDSQFFEQAEMKVVNALRSYAERAQNGQRLRRRLFADDAVRGLAFVDLCHKSFDVVLMNPPFGSASPHGSEYLRRRFPIGYVDMYCSFVERACQLARPFGIVGAITSRTGFFLKSFEPWRRTNLLGDTVLGVAAHLGQGVLDTAMVETVAYTIDHRGNNRPIINIDLVEEEDKEESLSCLVGRTDERVSARTVTQYFRMPFASLAQGVASELESDFCHLPPFSQSVEICRGGNSSDDERFVRAAWEVCPRDLCPGPDRRWRWFSKGGDFGVFYSPIHLALDWRKDGGLIGETMYQNRPREGYRWGPKSGFQQYMGRPGIVWSRRSQKGVSFRLLPADCAFSDKSPLALSGDRSTDLALVAILNTNRVQKLASCLTNFGSYEAGIIGSIPVDLSSKESFEDLGARGFQLARSAFVLSEIDPHHNVLSRGNAPNVHSLIRGYLERVEQVRTDLLGLLARINSAYSNGETELDDRYASMFDSVVEQIGPGAFMSEFVGFVFGRWDVRSASVVVRDDELPKPFEPLPVCPPGMLRGDDGLPATCPLEGYPLRINWDGILVDDPDHPDDIIRRIRDALELIWKDRADAIESEACEILGLADLRDYFRRPGAGGFWDDHIKRYTKSRRKAPIYWLIQSSKKNYALWIYYHRLDKDILFKALLNYVEPKIRKEDARLNELRSQKSAHGPALKGSKKLYKDIDNQEAFLSELRDFEDKLRRAANLNLDPDINDGVVLNIAPLRELVPWKEAKSYWDDLMDGQYEWSSIAKQLREKGLVSSPAT